MNGVDARRKDPRVVRIIEAASIGLDPIAIDSCIESGVLFRLGAHSVTLTAQVPDDSKWEEPLLPWDVPTRYSIDPYPTIDSLYAGTRAKRWWYRQHAVYVLGVLLSETARPWYNDASHYSALRQAAIARRR